jgi:hypothetical protein
LEKNKKDIAPENNEVKDNNRTKKIKESRTIETFFRNALRSNLDLTTLADSKASILISVNGFILTVVVTASGVYLSNPDMIYPFISIMITALASISLGAMAIHPRYKKELIKKGSLKEFNSVLYYQDMATIDPDEYVDKVKKILKDKDETYEHLIKHYYILGAEIAVKYKWLRRAYLTFALGLLVSTAFIVFSLIKMEKELTPPQQFEKIFEPSGATLLTDGKVLLMEDESLNTMHLVEPNSDNTVQELGTPIMNKKIKKILKKKVRDVEGVTNNGHDRIYAITSHSTNKSRKRKKAREQIVRFDYHDGKIDHLKLYHGLSSQLQLLHPTFKQALSDLLYGSRKKQINIEALSWEKKRKILLIGFRSPLIDGKAPIVVLENPNGVFDNGEKPRLKAPILLDLQGHGIRGMTWDEKKKGYWISAGSVGSRKHESFNLWFWDKEKNQVKKMNNTTNLGYAEGLATLPDGRILVVDDDGSISTHGANYNLIDTNKSSEERKK